MGLPEATMPRMSGFDVERVARLASLGLTPQEAKRLSEEFKAILEFVDEVRALPLEGVHPSVHALAPPMPFEDDKPHRSLSEEAALCDAPESQDGFLKVPQVLPKEEDS